MRHHFVPEFLQQGWVTPSQDNTLQEFRVDLPGAPARRRAPKATGFKRDLWALTSDPLGKRYRHDIEELVFKQVDNDAAIVRSKIINGGLKKLTVEDRRIWVRFLISLRLRQPDLIAHLKKDAEISLRADLQDVPASYEEMCIEAGLDPSLERWIETTFPGAIECVGLTYLAGLMDNQKYGEKIASARWWVCDLSASKHELILADDPCLFEGELHAPHFVLALPISPSKAFLITRGYQTADRLRTVSPTTLACWFNESSVKQASERVYALDMSPKRFIENRISKARRRIAVR